MPFTTAPTPVLPDANLPEWAAAQIAQLQQQLAQQGAELQRKTAELQHKICRAAAARPQDPEAGPRTGHAQAHALRLQDRDLVS